MIWRDINNSKPIAFESGNWDGLRSEKIIVKDVFDEFYIATMYLVLADITFYDKNEYEIENVTHWANIDFHSL